MAAFKLIDTVVRADTIRDKVADESLGLEMHVYPGDSSVLYAIMKAS